LAWQAGFTERTIYKNYNHFGERVYYGSTGYQQYERLEYLSRGKKLPNSPRLKSFTIGIVKRTLCEIIKIESSYNIMPSE
jgi:hypothetical protein